MMKTEQEQRQAIRQILFDANDICQATPCENEYCVYHGDYRCYDNVIVDKLIKASYGDVSEYKAEIEQLKAKNNVLKDGVVKAFTNGFNEGMKQVEKDIRRAKIDTINTIIKYCETPNHWNELKDCKLWGGKSDDLREFLNGIFKELKK